MVKPEEFQGTRYASRSAKTRVILLRYSDASSEIKKIVILVKPAVEIPKASMPGNCKVSGTGSIYDHLPLLVISFTQGMPGSMGGTQ